MSHTPPHPSKKNRPELGKLCLGRPLASLAVCVPDRPRGRSCELKTWLTVTSPSPTDHAWWNRRPRVILHPIHRKKPNRPDPTKWPGTALFWAYTVQKLVSCKVLRRMPKTGPFLAIWSDRDDSNLFCYLESECNTLKTAGSSCRDLYSHPDPIQFSVWTPL